jgi:hypothetical protein
MIRSLVLLAIIILTISVAISTITLVTPFMPVSGFSSKGSPEQSCSPNGVSGTDVNPNCIGGRLPSCTAHNKDSAAGCRVQGTCEVTNGKRKIESTPACVFN